MVSNFHFNIFPLISDQTDTFIKIAYASIVATIKCSHAVSMDALLNVFDTKYTCFVASYALY